MSIASDIRAYADSAVSQGKQVLDTAQAQLNDYTGQANDIVGKTRDNVSDIAEKAAEAVTDLRQSAEKAVNLDALTSAVEPYLAQLKEYSSVVTDKVDALVSTARNDKRVAALIERGQPVFDAVYELAQDRVVKPVQSFTGRGKPAAARPASKPSPKPRSTSATVKAPRKAAVTKPATKSSARPATRKTATKRTTKS